MALTIVLVLLTIAIAAVITFGDRSTLRRFRRPRLRLRRRPRLRRRHVRTVVPTATWTELTSAPSSLSPGMAFGPQDAESMLVALLLSGRLCRRDYQQQMAQLAAEDSARGARP
jgi:hypothetical protein